MEAIELRNIRAPAVDIEHIEAVIKRAFRECLYTPILLMLSLPEKTLKNAPSSALQEAVASGRVTYAKGIFSGRFSAAVSKELKALGAVWDRRLLSWRLPLAAVPHDIRATISASAAHFEAKLKKIDTMLQQNLPAGIAGRVQVSEVFDQALWKVDKAVAETLRGMTVPPQLTPERRQRIAAEWQENLDLWIKDFAEEEILKLRKSIARNVYSGSRRDQVIRSIQKSYGVSVNKAKFLAQQETNLLLTKFKETRYTDSGVDEYRWRCVAGSKNHPVRPSHKILDGTIQRWDAPPITTAPNEPPRRNNPGQDYRCRCAAHPIVKFKAS